MLLLVEAAQALPYWLRARADVQGVLGDLPQDAWHIRGFPRKNVFVVAEEVDERAFLFVGERGTDAYRFTLRVVGVYEDLLRALYRFE